MTDLLATIKAAPVEELPRLLGQLREAEAAAMARLCSARPVYREPEQLLGVEEAAKRLGCSKDFLYRHWKQYPFARKEDWGLCFSESGLNAYIRRGQK
jgi:predicted DNA-binding transcriptional regulator AlpA